MDNIREKLVWLIYHFADYLSKRDAEYLADHLIANGVTVQEWIPASEPPETNGCYLVAGNLRWDGKPMTREAYWNGEDWLSCYDKSNITRRITHWMPLPTPPKGATDGTAGELPPKKRKLSKRESERMDAIRWCELLRGWTFCDGNCPVCYALEEGE